MPAPRLHRACTAPVPLLHRACTTFAPRLRRPCTAVRHPVQVHRAVRLQLLMVDSDAGRGRAAHAAAHAAAPEAAMGTGESAAAPGAAATTASSGAPPMSNGAGSANGGDAGYGEGHRGRDERYEGAAGGEAGGEEGVAAAKKLDGAMSLALGMGGLDLLDGAGAEEVATANPNPTSIHPHPPNPTHLHPSPSTLTPSPHPHQMELGLDGDGGGVTHEVGDEHAEQVMHAELAAEGGRAFEHPSEVLARLRGASAAATAAPAAAPSTAPASAAVMSLRLPSPTLTGGADTSRQSEAALAAMSVAGDVGALQAAGPAPSPLLMPTHRRGGQPSGAGRAAAVVGSLLPTWREATQPRGRPEDEAASSSEIASGRQPPASARGAPAAVPAIDCMLRESALDRSSPWVASLRAHRSYWGSKDVMLFVLTRLVYGGEAAGSAPGPPPPQGPEGAPAHATHATVGEYDVQ